MATKEEGAAKEAAKQPAKQAVNLQLMPANGSDQPVLANVTMVEPAAGVALLDFGFLDPGTMAALTRMARAGKQVPERLNGRLAARVAISHEALATLHQQIGGVLQAVSRRQKTDAR